MPSPVYLSQTILPEARSMQSACKVWAFASITEVKTRSPKITGVEALGPGISSAQSACSGVHVDGNPISGEEPLNSGPRHCAQSAANAAPTESNEPTNNANFIT